MAPETARAGAGFRGARGGHLGERAADARRQAAVAGPIRVSTRGGWTASQAAMRIRVVEHVADLVGAGQQHQLRERVDVEVDRRAVREQEALLREVDPELGVGVALDELEQPLVGRRVDDDRQHPVLQRVAA